MPPSRTHALAMEVAAVGLPLLLVYVGRTFLASPPPAPILAQQDTPVITPTAAQAAIPLSAEQQKAAEWMRQLPVKYALTSPLNHPVAAPLPPKTDRVEVKEAPKPEAPRIDPIAGLKLTAVLGNDEDRLAAINGKIYRIGDTVRKGLKLTAIDARNARITLSGDDGSIYQIKREIK